LGHGRPLFEKAFSGKYKEPRFIVITKQIITINESTPEFGSLEQFTRRDTVSKNDHNLKLIKYIFKQ
jgi:hypothetical protein